MLCIWNCFWWVCHTARFSDIPPSLIYTWNERFDMFSMSCAIVVLHFGFFVRFIFKQFYHCGFASGVIDLHCVSFFILQILLICILNPIFLSVIVLMQFVDWLGIDVRNVAFVRQIFTTRQHLRIVAMEFAGTVKYQNRCVHVWLAISP